MIDDDDESRGHWDQVYERNGPDDVSWFQPSLHASLELLARVGLPSDAGVIDVGGGASTLVDDLLARGFTDISVLDISERALAASRARLGEDRARGVTWIAADITRVELPAARYDFWHDRAVFHFLTREADRKAYVRAALRSLRPGGHIVVATFGPKGPTRCSGLEVVRYDADALHGEFGSRFAPVEHVSEVHRTPWGGEQEFLYCCCRKT